MPPHTRLGRVLLMWLALVAGSVAVLVFVVLLITPAFAHTGPVRFKDVAGVNEATRIELPPLAQRSYVYAADGSLLTVLKAEQNRNVVALEAIAPIAQQAVVSTEDRNFYQHHGFDVRAMLRAAAVGLDQGGASQGGSTITQQVIKNSSYGSGDRNARRKVAEAMLATRLEEQLAQAAPGRDRMAAKRQILERYLNLVYLGHGAYGLEAGAEVYFAKPASQLQLGEAALLAGLISAPNELDPLTKPEKAKARRSLVLQRMYDDGAITATQRQAAEAAPLPTEVHLETSAPVTPTADYFTEEVKQILLDDKTLGDTPEARANALFNGGLRITTTLDPRLQRLATDAVYKTIPEQPPFTASMAALDSQTGAVRAIVGGRDFGAQKYDLAVQARKPFGSAFKAVTLTTALANGYSPADKLDGRSPCILGRDKNSPRPSEGPFKNAEGAAGSILDLRAATVGSVNCAYLHLAEAVGPDQISDMAMRMGFGSLDGHKPQEEAGCPCASITLGAVGASPLDMAAVMSTLAAEGVRHKPYFVEKIEDANGRALYAHAAAGERVVERNVALTVTSILRRVIEEGTGYPNAVLARGRPASGKTGTDDNFVNAAFVGYTKHLSVAVWMGDPAGNDTRMTSVGDVGPVYGGTYPAMIFKAFMDPAHEGIPPEADAYEAPDLSVFKPGRNVGYFAPTPTTTPPPSPTPSPGKPPTPSSPQGTTTTSTTPKKR